MFMWPRGVRVKVCGPGKNRELSFEIMDEENILREGWVRGKRDGSELEQVVVLYGNNRRARSHGEQENWLQA